MRRLIPSLLLAAAACAHAPKAAEPVATAAPAPAPVAQAPAPAAPVATACRADADCTATQLCLASSCVDIDATTAACDGLAAHFDFDQATIRVEDTAALQRAARCAQARPASRLRIEGNCDERGTTAYNLALGQRRAAATQKYLVDLGVPAGRTSTISYGKEKPRCTEHTEACWAEDRRADLAKAQ